MANTDLSDINEIYLGYFLSNKSWFSKEAKRHVDTKIRKVRKDQAEDQIAKAEAMAQKVIEWAKSKKYKGSISNVWWTARPGSLSEAVGREVDQRKNPTDILVRFADGPGNGFLGISAKSTSGSGDIGFKNPGVGTMESVLGIDISNAAEKYIQEAIKKFDLNSSATKRKIEIRSNPKIKVNTEEMGSKALADMRNIMFEKLFTMSNKQLLDFLLNNWLDASKTLYPPYIKVTGMGNKEPYSAKVDDPLNNPKLKSLISDKIKIVKVGNESIGVMAGSHRILKMRFKFESEKLASSIKLSGDPW